jgi:hypothetical protein
VAQRILGRAADLRIAAVCRCDTQHGFELRLNNLQFAKKSQSAKKHVSYQGIASAMP